MRVVCAWCSADLGRKCGPPAAVSHGVCPQCRGGLLAEAAAERYRHLLAAEHGVTGVTVARCGSRLVCGWAPRPD